MAATDERAIHEFPTGTIDDNSLLIMDRPTLTPGEYETEKFAIANLGLKLLGGIDFPNNLDTDEQDIFGAINEVNAKAMNIAEEYDETESYSKGDYCIYQNTAYRCIKASGTTTGTFVAADWTQIKVLSEVKGKANYSEVTTPTLNNQFIDTSDSWFYVKKIGDFCYINGRLKLISAVANNYGLVFNMPLASGNSLMMVFVSGRDFNNKANTFIVSCVISNGTLTIQTYPDNIESGKYLYINGFYACQ